MKILFLILISLVGFIHSIIIQIEEDKRQCERIKVPLCNQLEYNMTILPNEFGHETQKEIETDLNQFYTLISAKCSHELKFFLCSMYTPICVDNYHRPIRACRSVCERVKFGCERLLRQYGFEWPSHFNCDLFPEYGSSKEVCMDPMDALMQQKQEQTQRKIIIKPKKDDCPSDFIKVTDQFDVRFGRVTTGNVKNCLQTCKSPYFDEKQLKFSYFWILCVALLAFLSSTWTTITYLIEIYRFKYPEKPIIYLSICYLFISFGYLLRYIVGHEETSCEFDGSIRYSYGSLNLSCTVTFILTYYFTMASALWWIVVSLTWFLAAGRKWSIESIAAYNSYFHFAAWLIPGIKTVIILALELVDGDSLSGICSVGNLNTTSLKWFVIGPMIVCLATGVNFLLFGFLSLVRLRRLIRHQHQRTDKLEKLMLRIGVFSILYTVPQTCVIVCLLYENYNRSSWELGLIKSGQHPEFAVFMLKYFMSLIIGITSGFWICSWKTLHSWKLFLTCQPKSYHPPSQVNTQANLYKFPSLQSEYCNISMSNHAQLNKAAAFYGSSKYSLPCK